MIKLNLKEGFQKKLRRIASKNTSEEKKRKNNVAAHSRIDATQNKRSLVATKEIGKVANARNWVSASIARGAGARKFKRAKQTDKKYSSFVAKRAGLTEGSQGRLRAIRKMRHFVKKGDMSKVKDIMGKRLTKSKERQERHIKMIKSMHPVVIGKNLKKDIKEGSGGSSRQFRKTESQMKKGASYNDARDTLSQKDRSKRVKLNATGKNKGRKSAHLGLRGIKLKKLGKKVLGHPEVRNKLVSDRTKAILKDRLKK